MEQDTRECDKSELVFAQMIDEYVDRVSRGETPDKREYLGRLPDRRTELEECLRSVDAIAWTHIAEESERSEPPGEAAESVPRPTGFPELIGDFRIIRRIGKGGMGEVYEAEQLPLKRRVALKILLPSGIDEMDAATKDKWTERFQREAELVARLQHENIVQVYWGGEAEGRYCFAMELVKHHSIYRSTEV